MGFLKIKIKGLGFLIGLSIKPNIIALMYVTLKKKNPKLPWHSEGLNMNFIFKAKLAT